MPKPNHQVPEAAGEIGSARRTSVKGRRGIRRRPRSASASSSWGGGAAGCKKKKKARVGDEEKKPSSMVPAVYDANADIEEEYRLFLENVRVYENDDFVVEYEGVVVRYGGEAVADHGAGTGAPPVKGLPDPNQLDGSVQLVSKSPCFV